MTKFKYLLPFFLPFIFAPSVVFSDEIRQFICPPNPFGPNTSSYGADPREDHRKFAVQRVGDLEVKRLDDSDGGNPTSYFLEVTNEVTIPGAKTNEEVAELFFEKYREVLNIKTLFKDLKIVRSTGLTVRYKPYYNGLPIADSYFEFTTHGNNTLRNFSMNEIPVARVATDKLPTDPAATITAASSIGTKAFGPLLKASPAELVYAVRDGVAYPAWTFFLQYKGAPFVVTVFDHDHSIYSGTCTAGIPPSLKNFLYHRVL